MGANRLDVRVILDAAAREFALHGFEGMSMRILADKLSVSASAIYYHFSSKEAIYDEVCHHIFDDMVTAVDTALKGAKTAEERMARFISTVFDAWENSTLLVLTQRDVINATISPERSFASPHYRLLFGVIRKIQSQHFHNEIEDQLSFAFGSMIFGYCSLLIYSQHESGLSAAEHRLKRKGELLALCGEFMRTRSKGTG